MMNCDFPKIISHLNLPLSRIWATLYKHGAVFFQGCELSLEEFDLFSDQFRAQDIIHGGSRKKITLDDRIQDVTEGHEEVMPHIEMGRRPDQPDLAWFYCQQPADIGGETTLVDGLKVTSYLRPETTDFFRINSLCFEGVVERASWSRSFNITNFEELKNMLISRYASDSVIFEFHDSDESFVGRFLTSAFKGKAFANSIFGPYKGKVGGHCTVNNRDIPQPILQELQKAYKTCTVTLKMEAGSFIMIDNTRVMHGRCAFPSQTSRKMFAKFMHSKREK